MKKLLVLILIGFSIPGLAQFTVTPNSTASILAQKIAGSGLTVFNASLNCGANASGIFDYTGGNIGISKGIILSTGSATDVANPGTYFCNTMNSNQYTDPDLTAISAGAIYDVCMLEYDVVAMYNNVNISYIFCSEEYPTFVNQYNDAFGFFLTGPNPNGGYYNGVNIGTLPNGTTAVSINTVNAGLNSVYFHDNYTSPNNDVAYDGYTILINSVAPIYADSVYHMKIAIADALDESYDSGILIHDTLFTSKPGGTTGMAKNIQVNAISVFPNPATDFIQLNLPVGSGWEVSMFNSTGGKVNSFKINQPQQKVNIKDLPGGIYFVQITGTNGNFYKTTFVKR